MGIYLDADDRHVFLGLLKLIAGDSEWTLHAWCLMTNHFHLLVETPHPNLSAGMHRLNGRYAQLFNSRHMRTGHVFERRFGAKAIEGEHQLRITAQYVFDNPIKAGLCMTSSEWPWLGGKLMQLAVPARVNEEPCPVPGTGHGGPG